MTDGAPDPGFSPDDKSVEVRFVRSSGPGGQNVNKVSTAVELRFTPALDDKLTPEVRERLLRLAGRRATADHVIVIQAQRFRSQIMNREDALRRLADLVARAMHRPEVRIATKPGPAARRRRLTEKRVRAATKVGRSAVRSDSD